MAATTPNPGPYDLGPFQMMTGIQWGSAAVETGTVTAVAENTLTLYNSVACNVYLDDTAPPLGRDNLAFVFDAGTFFGITPDELFTATYTGVTSGLSWVPADTGGGLTELCASGINRKVYSAGASVPVNAGVCWQWVAQMSQATINVAGTAANWGRFLSRLPVPGSGLPQTFVNGERFTVTI